MAMFFDFPVSAPESYTPINAAWHTKHPLLAVAAQERRQGMTSGSVSLYTQDGEHLSESTLQRAAKPTTIAWHPTLKLLATGWASGELIMWNEETHMAYECKRMHDNITCLTWSHDGSRLFSADDEGQLCVWRISKTGKASLTYEHKADTGFTHCVAVTAGSEDTSMVFLGTFDKGVMLADATGACTPSFPVTDKIVDLVFDPESASLVVATQDMMVVHHHVAPDGAVKDKYEFKMSGKAFSSLGFAGPGILIAATSENQIRVWCSEEGDSYSLSIAHERGEFTPSDIIQTVAYNPANRIIAGTSRNGMVFMWKFKGEAFTDRDSWSFLPPIELRGSLVGAQWGPDGLLLVRNASDTVSILREHIMRKHFCNNTAVVQVSSTRFVVEVHNTICHDVDADFAIKGLSTDGECVCVWSGKQVAVFELVKDGEVIRNAGQFSCEAVACALHAGTVFTAEGSKIHARTHQGSSKQMLVFGEDEQVTHLHCNNNFLAAAAANGVLRVWDLSRREARPHAGPRDVTEDVDGVRDVAVNCTGTHVSFLATVDGKPDTSVWVWAVESDAIISQAFGVGGRCPVSQQWDNTDGRLLVCETHLPSSDDGSAHAEATTIFMTPDNGMVVQQTTALTPLDVGPLLGVQVPNLYFALRGKSDEGHITRAVPMRDFAGLENADKDTKAAMLEFSYQLTVGNLDAAFKSVRAIDNASVWANMARMCVANKRLDVAAVCMGKLGDAPAARVLREADKEAEPEAKVAALAVQLRMYEQAEQLYKDCGRYDLLNRLYQDQGRWDDAVRVALEHDRMHMRNTYYRYAQHLEALGRTADAIKHYELAETHAFEVPRLLFNEPENLEAYVKQSKSKQLLKWWAQYLESTQELDEARKFYAAADDALSLVRVYCYCEEVDKARELVSTSKNKAAAYHLAKYLEDMGEFEEAVSLYSQAASYNNAIRLAKEHGLKQQMLSLALKSTKGDMMSAAEYYESQGAFDKAVMLYHKAGRVSKALDMCFQHNLFQALSEITQHLSEGTDPELLEKASSFFTNNGQYEKAVNLLVVAGQFHDALDLIARHGVHLTDEWAEKMTYARGEVDKKVRNALLTRIADVCFNQGSYQLATRKYTQAGQHVKAMKALLKCGDTNKIIFFANKCRQREVYVLAANYLQSLNWRRDPEIMKHIISFYTKGRALDSLASFYEACAGVEIDDYQNYEKALGALNEALRCMSRAKMKDLDLQEQRVASLQQRIESTRRFVAAKQIAEEDPSEMVAQMQQLLQEPDIDQAVRIGDIYGVIIEHLASREQYAEAYDNMQELRKRIPNVNVAYYVNMRVIEAVHNALNIPLGQGQGPAVGGGDDDEIGEEIEGQDV